MRTRLSSIAICLLTLGLLAAAAPAGELDDFLKAHEALGFSGAAIAVEFDADGGETVILRGGYGVADPVTGRRNTPDTQFDIGSLTKQFTAALVLRLAELGKLRTDETLGDFIDGLDEAAAGITVHQLLNHTSGLPPTIPAGSMTTERDELIALVRATKPLGKPGGQWVYNNIGYCLLAALTEIRTGETYEALVKKHLFEPAGMTRSGFLGEDGNDPKRMAHGFIEPWADRWGPAVEGWYSWGLRGAGGILTTVDDLLAWERALRTPDVVLTAASLEKLFTATARTPFGSGYAYGWNVTAFEGHALITHGGDTRGFATKYYRYPDDGVFVAWLCNNEVPEHMIAVNLARAAIGLSYPTPPMPFAIEPEALAAFAGTFTGDGGSVSISVEHGRATLLPLDAKLGSAGFTKNPRPGGVDLDAAGERFIAAIVADHPEGLKDIISDRFDAPSITWAQRLLNWLRDGDKGALQDGTVIGSTIERGAPTTWLSLHYAEGDTLIGLIWEFGTDRVIGINTREASGMRLHLVPRSATECLLWNRRLNSQVGSLRREPAEGPAAAITIKRPDGETSYERAGGP